MGEGGIQTNGAQDNFITMHKALHPRNNVHKLYVPRKEGGRGLARFENCVQKLEDSIKKSKE